MSVPIPFCKKIFTKAALTAAITYSDIVATTGYKTLTLCYTLNNGALFDGNVKMQASFDGVLWFDLASGTNISGVNVTLVAAISNVSAGLCPPMIRAYIGRNSGTADFDIYLHALPT